MNKIKIAYLTKDMPVNGISTVLMNYCMHLNQKDLSLTIFSGPPIAPPYRQQCNDLGIQIIETPPKRERAIAYYISLWKLLSRKNYDIVHIHGNSATITIELMIAFLKGIKVRIAHCHNSTCDSKKAHYLLQPLFKKLYTHGFACSNLAGQWLFDDHPFEILPNGFCTSGFHFDPDKRSALRKELHLENAFVIGHVGMFNKQKNHPFLLKVFEQVAKERKNAYLLLIGQGPDFEKINHLIQKHPFKHRIICYGPAEHVADLYNVMDTFLFPSLHEGLGIVLLEAQINGLPCITSDVVPSEVSLGESISFLSLEEDLETWKSEILKNHAIDRTTYTQIYKKEIERFEITQNAKNLYTFYKNVVRKNI